MPRMVQHNDRSIEPIGTGLRGSLVMWLRHPVGEVFGQKEIMSSSKTTFITSNSMLRVRLKASIRGRNMPQPYLFEPPCTAIFISDSPVHHPNASTLQIARNRSSVMNSLRLGVRLYPLALAK